VPIIAKGSSKQFEPCPEGVHQAVCCDVIDLGEIETMYGPKWKIDIRWQVSETMADGQPYLVNKRYTKSLNEKATLRHDLEAWRGRAFTEAELAGFDIEVLIGVNCLLNVQHKQGSKGGTFANVVSIMPITKGMTKLKVADDYIRHQDRNTTPEPEQTRDDDDAIPF